ncbi:MAG: EAL domain-containing protein [Ketobacter sp.]|nr:MAG: EAL domain-containing protein [Ketobacter sp.]
MQISGKSVALTLKQAVWLFFVLCLLCLTCTAKAAGLELTPGLGRVSPAQHIDYLEDARNRLGVTDLLHQGGALPWQALQDDVPGFGFSDTPHWLRIPVRVFDTEIPWYLEVAYPHLDYLDIYFVVNNQLIEQHHMGDTLPFYDRLRVYRSFLVLIPSAEKLTALNGDFDGTLEVYFRVQTQGILKVPVTFWEQNAFWKKEQVTMMVKGGYFGLLLIMALYNFVLFFVVRLRSYLFYVVYVLFIGLYGFSMEGFGYQYLWPDYPGWQEVSAMMFLLFSTMFRCVFTMGFLELKQRWQPGYNFLMALVSSSLLLLILSVWLPYNLTVRLVTVLVIPSTLSCLVIGIVLYFKGFSSARYFVIGWLMYYLGALAAIFSNIGLIAINDLTENLLYFGVVAEIILFSLALADRINQERRQKVAAQNQSISNLERYKSLYDNAIEGVFQCSVDGKLKGANPAMSTMLGYSDAEELIQVFNIKGLDSFFDAMHFNEFNQALAHNGRVQNYEMKGFRSDGQVCWLSVSAQVETGLEAGDERVINGFVFDITQRKRSEEQLLFLSRHDPLTGLVNRREFEGRLEQALDDVRKKHEVHTFLLLDLDQFRLINDSCGHVAGDELLRQVTSQLRALTRGGDVLARLGGDEFAILLSNCGIENARAVADKVRIKIQDMRFAWDNRAFDLAGSVGLVSLNDEIGSVKELINKADAACHSAKESGRNRVHVFDPADTVLASQQTQMQWAARITEALEHDLFELHVQPIIPTRSELIHKSSFEVLLRLRYRNELVFPGSFLPAAERYNLMPKVDRWVVRNVFSWLHKNPEKAATLADVAINLSGLTLGDEGFADFLHHQFNEFRIAPEKICFEITETIAVTNLSTTIQFIDKFRGIGCSFSLDDFGSGFSSYGYLKNLPVDYLKIDGTFVRDLEHNEIDRAMVESINRIGHVMGKKTIAEFVENDRILALLRELGVDYAQGYGISKPFPIDQISAQRYAG